jgi:hypothetical protein
MKIYKYYLKAEPGYENIEIADNSIVLPILYELGEPVCYCVCQQDTDNPLKRTITFLKVETGETFTFKEGKMYNYLSTVHIGIGHMSLHFFLVSDIPKQEQAQNFPDKYSPLKVAK